MVVKPKKSLGQNFLRDPNTARKIVAALDARPGDPVVEIGPGQGALTGLLLERYPSLVAVEIDQRAVELLKERYPNLDLRRADVLDIDWLSLRDELGGVLHLIGNLPYYITSQIFFSVLDAGSAVREAVFMMQLEVAERLVSLPGSKAYGILSVWGQLNAEIQILFRVSRNVFYPKPDVTSAVVKLRPHARSVFRDDDEREFTRRLVRGAFNQRRKVLRNSLARVVPNVHELPEDIALKRPEELPPQSFLSLARSMRKQNTDSLS